MDQTDFYSVWFTILDQSFILEIYGDKPWKSVIINHNDLGKLFAGF